MGASKHRPDAREQLLDVERLRHVVVGAELQTLNLVALLALGGQQDDREPRGSTPRLTELESGAPRQADIENHEIRGELFRGTHRVQAVVYRSDAEAFVLEVAAQ